MYDTKRLFNNARKYKKSKWLMHNGIPEIVVVLYKRSVFQLLVSMSWMGDE